MKTKTIIYESICYLIALLFLYTGISKMVEHSAFEFDLVNAPVIKSIAPIMYKALPSAEVLVALCLIIPRFRKIGLICSVVFMTIFTIYVGGVLGLADHKPCTCGGVLREMSWTQHLYLNIFFLTISIYGLILHKKQNHFTLHPALGSGND